MRRLWLTALLLLPCLSCTRVNLAWKLAPWYLDRQAQDYLQLQGPQRENFKRELDAFLRRTARERGPRLAGLAQALSAQVLAGHDAQALDAALDGLEKEWTLAVEPVLPAAARWIAQAPAASMRAGFAKSNGRLEKREEGGPAARLERVQARLKDWLGSVKEPQKAWAQGWVNQPDAAVGWRANRARFQALLLGLLDKRAPAAEVQKLLKDWWLPLPGSAGFKTWESQRARSRQQGLLLLATLDPEQRRYLALKLQLLSQHLLEIAAGAEKPAK
jgi:hypothetical protein